MDVRFIVISLVLLLFGGTHDINAFVMQCPAYLLHFQKLVGYRPPSELTSQMNLIYSGDDSSDPSNPICFTICNNDENCMGYVLLLDTNECYSLSVFDHIDVEIDLVADGNAIYFEKVCLKVPDVCRSKLWAITKIPGSSLVFQGKKTISTLVSRRECAERCLHEREFHCLSASFTPSHKNNQIRLSQQPNRPDTVGRCILSDADKTIRPDAFRAAPFEEEYIENQCYDRPAESDNCSYELYSNSSFVYSEHKYIGLTQKECQSKCSHELRFYCQGASYYSERFEIANSECLLHSEDVISMGPRSVRFKLKSVYMRRVACLDISVICNSEEMVIKYTPKSWFRGHMYVSSHSKDCSATGNGTGPTILNLQIGSEIKESKCGILRAYEVTKNYQRIFISTLVVVQHNLNVQTQGDRLVKVGCIISNATSNEGIGMVPDPIALGSSLAFAQTGLPNQGSIHYNLTNLHIPKIRMQVVDLGQHIETNDVQIGQNLELQIIADPPDTPYDFAATSLVVKSNNQTNLVLLIDENGCPTDASIFPALEKIATPERKMLRAKFHAFKFAGTSFVSFDVKIHFCLDKCPAKDCAAGRGRKRRTDSEFVQIKNPIYISSFTELEGKSTTTTPANEDITTSATANGAQRPFQVEVPLNYQLNVHGPHHVGTTEGLVYGENGLILIADHDHSETICINQSLLIAILIFWIIFQIILMICCCHLIRKYKYLSSDDDRKTLQQIHESLEYYEGRRVRWADQGGHTL